MSLPTSFFHTRTPLGGGGWLLQWDTTNKTFNVGATHDSLRYNDAQQALYVGFDDSNTIAGSYRSAHIIKLDKTGAILAQDGFNRGSNVELRSFDVFDDGSIIWMAENAANTYVGTVNSNLQTNGTGHYFSNSIYGMSIARREGVTTGQTYDKQIKFCGYSSADGRAIFRRYGWDSGTNFAGLNSQQSHYGAGAYVVPYKMLVREDNQISAMCGRRPDYSNSPYIQITSAAMSVERAGIAVDYENASLSGDCQGGCWEYGQRNIASNTDNAVIGVGYQNVASGERYGQLMKVNDSGLQFARFLKSTNNYGDTINLKGAAYDDVGNNGKMYICGQAMSPLPTRRTLQGSANKYDGILVKVDVTGNSPSVDWAIGFAQTQSNQTEHHVYIYDVVVDDDGQAVVSGLTNGYSNGNANQLFMASLPSNGSVPSGVINGMNIYDATSHFEITTPTTFRTASTDLRTASWSETNQSVQRHGNNAPSPTLTEF